MSNTVPTNVPVGAVIAVFLSDDQIARLAPIWVPADGRVHHEQGSVFDGIELPNLNDDRVILASSTASGPYDPPPTTVVVRGWSGLSELHAASSMQRGEFHGTPVWDVQDKLPDGTEKRRYSVVLDGENVNETGGNVRVLIDLSADIHPPTPRG